MADAMETLKNILGDDAEDKIKTVMSSMSSPSVGGGGNAPSINTDSLEQIMQLKNIMENLSMNRSDPRTNLLLSLKPYMRSGRQSTIDSAVRMLGLTNITKFLRR